MGIFEWCISNVIVFFSNCMNLYARCVNVFDLMYNVIYNIIYSSHILTTFVHVSQL